MPALIHKRLDGTEKTIALGAKPAVVGRLPESEIQVRDSFISRVHCGISWVNDQFTLKDLGSTNGTYRNGARVFECALAAGDKIQIGNATLVFEIDPATNNGILRQVPQMVTPPRPAERPVVSPGAVTQPTKVPAPPTA
jgi:pSer/pThr/pTyr-binding forkhead associated (FHA) protein